MSIVLKVHSSKILMTSDGEQAIHDKTYHDNNAK